MTSLRHPIAIRVAALGLLGLFTSAGTSRAQIAVSANDNKAVLVDGVNTVVRNPAPDTVTIIDLGAPTPRIVADLRAPNSVIGPPQTVAIAPDGSIALVASSTKLDPTDPSRTVPDDVVTVIDLRAAPPRIAGAVHAGRGASGLSFSPAGTLALVANRIDGTVSVFTVSGTTLTRTATVDLGAPDSGPSHVAFARDGRTALVTRNNDSLISLLSITGTTVTYSKQDIAAGLKPYGLDISPTADLAVVGHVGAGATGGVDTLGLIDLAASPIRTIDQVAAGPTVEGVAISPDGRFVAATVMNGSNLAGNSPLFHDAGLLRVFGLQDRALAPVAQAPTGHWCQGAGWSGDGRTIVVQCMADREIRVFHFDGRVLTAAPSLPVSGGPAGLRVARP
jgi:DNA-binding beta-propeller fold protein YncE